MPREATPDAPDAPNILERTGAAAKELAREFKKNPVKTTATMVASPAKSLSDAVIAPSVGESRLTSGDSVTGRDEDGFLIVRNARTGRTRRIAPDETLYDESHGAVTGKQRLAGLAQVAAEMVAGPVAGKVTKIAKPVVGKTAGRAAGGAVAGAGVGAVNAPDDPGVGAILGAGAGATLAAGGGAVGDQIGGRQARRDARARLAGLEDEAVVAAVRRAARKNRGALARRLGRTTDAPSETKPAPTRPMPPSRGTDAPSTEPAPPLRTTVARIPTSEIHVDPARFQFKQGNDPATGTGGELKSVDTFNPELAGVIAVWRDPANGRTYVVNGHHRVELAKRTGHPEMDVRYIGARTAEEARARGALINIAEGRGTPVDVAKFLRDTGTSPDEMRAEGISLRGTLARDGVALGRLAPDLFDRVARGEIEQRHAVTIGGMLDDAALQRAAVQLIDGKRLADAEVAEVARQVRDAGTETVNQETLFGTEEMNRALIIERAQLAAAIKKRLSADRRTFGFVAKEGRAGELERAGNVIDVEQSRAIAEDSARLEEIFDRLYTRSGPVADALNEGARRIAHGERPKPVADELYDRIRAAVSEALGGAKAGDDPRSGGHAAERAIEPGPGDAGDVDELGRLRDSVDPNQSGFLSPRAPRGESASVDLFGERFETEPPQSTLFGGREGTEASRTLAQTEAAARSELSKLRDAFRLERDAGKRAQHAKRIAELEKLVNRDAAIGAEELRTRAAAEGDVGVEPPLDQQALFSPATRPGQVGQAAQQKLGLTAAQVDDLKTLGTISRTLADALGVPLRQGRKIPSSARGAFWPHAEVTRVIRYDHLDTAAHEAGHYVSKKYLAHPTMRGAAQRGAIKLDPIAGRELVKMGKDLYGSRKPAGGYGEEGIAQFFRFYVTDRARLPIEAPAFSRYMEQIFQREPALKAAFDQARADFEVHKAAPPQARIRAMISKKEKSRFLPTVDELVSDWVDDLDEFRAATESLGGQADPRQNAYTLARLTRGDAGAAQQMLETGVIDPATRQPIAQGILPVLREIGPDRLDDFRDYLVAERALEKAAQGIDTGISVGDAQHTVARLRPEFETAAMALWAHSQALIDYRVRQGLLTPEEGAAIQRKNQKRVPFYRVFDEGETAAGAGFGKRGARNFSGIHKMKGSSRQIIDPLESMMTDTHRTIRQANAHHAAASLLKQALRTEGGGRIAEIVPAPEHRVRISTAKALEQLEDMGYAIDDAGAVPGMEGIIDWQENIVGGARDAKDLVLPLLQNGERVWVAVRDRKLYDAILGLGPQSTHGKMWSDFSRFPAQTVIAGATRTLRAGATLTLEFMARNLGRDTFGASIYSQGSYRPPLWDLAQGLFHVARKTDTYRRWRLEGGDHAAILGLDRGRVRSQLDEALRGHGKMMSGLVLHPIDTLRMLSSLAENATRLGEFAKLEREAVAKGRSPETASKLAALGARDITIDFARAGTQARMVNQIMAFFNASLQSTAKLTRELRTRPEVIIPRAVASITVPSIALYLLQRDDPDYQELPRWEKDLFWIVIQRGENGELEHIWRIPKPFELGVVFGTVPERILEWIDQDDPAAIKHMVKSLVETFNPASWPNAILPVVEWIANKSLFRDAPLVPRTVEGLVPEEQATPYTGETARLAGRAIGESPAKIENTVKGYTGGLGRYALDASDKLIREGREQLGMPPLRQAPPAPDDPLASIPGVKGFVTRPPGENAESIQRIYEAFDEAEAKRRTWRYLLKQGRTEEARAFLEKHHAAIAAVATAEETGGEPGQLRQTYNAIGDVRRDKRQLSSVPMDEAERRQRAGKYDDALTLLARSRRPQR